MIEQTFDYGLVRSILTHPEVYGGIHDDYGVGRKDYQPPAVDAVIYLTDGKGLLFIAHPLTRVMWQGHQAALPAYRGRDCVRGLREAIDWMRDYGAHKLIGMTPAYNKAAIRTAVAAGMKREGVITSSFLRDGVLHDMVITGADLWASKQL